MAPSLPVFSTLTIPFPSALTTAMQTAPSREPLRILRKLRLILRRKCLTQPARLPTIQRRITDRVFTSDEILTTLHINMLKSRCRILTPAFAVPSVRNAAGKSSFKKNLIVRKKYDILALTL